MRAFLAGLFLVAVVQAAPVPKLADRDKVEAKFGKIVDPRGDTDFKLDGDTLVVTLPGKVRLGVSSLPKEPESADYVFKRTSPAIKLKDITGYFEIEFVMTAPLSPKAGALPENDAEVHIGAGIQYDCKPGETLCFGYLNSCETKADSESKLWIPALSSSHRFGFQGGGWNGCGKPEKPGRWKIRQRFDETGIHLSCETGGGKERLIFSSGLSFDPKEVVKPFLYFYHSSDTEHEVRIDDFKITPIEKK